MQPGDTITPGSQPQPAEPQAPSAPPSPPQAPQPEAPPAPVQAPSPAPPQVPQPTTPAQPTWQFNTSETDSYKTYESQPQQSQGQAVAWTASEYVAHHKNVGWFMMVFFGVVVAAVAIYFLTSEIVSAVVVGLVGMLFAVFGARQPQVLQYAIDNAGVHIGPKLYPYGQFKSFSVIEEGPIRSILFMPLQRFGLPITIYYDPAEEDGILQALGGYLPHVDRNPAPIDNLMRKIRF